MAPMMTHANDDDRKLFVWASCAPYLFSNGHHSHIHPQGEENPIPIIRKAAPARNSISGSRGMGVMVILRINSTMQVTGSTDDKDSVIFL